MRPIAYGLILALLLSLGSVFAGDEVKPSKALAFSAGVISALSGGLATYLTTGDLSPSLLIGATSGAVTTAFQYHSKAYSEWIGKKYAWEKTSKQGILSNFIKRAAVGLMVTGGIAFVATLPYVGLDVPPPYTIEGATNVLRNSLTMSVLSTPVNMALALLAKRKVENPGPIRKRLVEWVSFLVNGAQSASGAAAVGGHTTVANSITAALAAAGSAGWAYESRKKCQTTLGKVAGE